MTSADCPSGRWVGSADVGPGPFDPDPTPAVVGLLTTLDEGSAAVTMHHVPRALVEAQALSLGLPLHVVDVPQPCPDDEYRRRMDVALDAPRADGVTVVVFGDLHLADVRSYCEEAMAGSGLDPVFPLWDEPVARVALTPSANSVGNVTL